MMRLLAFSAVPLVLAAGMLGASGAQLVAAAAPQASPTCVLGIVCLPGDSSSPTSGPSSSPSPSPTSASPSPTTGSPSPTASPTASPGPAPSGGGPGPSASDTPSASTSPSASATVKSGAPKRKTRAAAKLAAATPGLVASSATSVLTAGSATVSGFIYVGNVDMPVAGGGTVTMMEFTAHSMSLAGGVTDSVTQGGMTTQTTSPELDFGANVTLYATSLSGSLLALPVTFTPSTASQLTNLLTGLTTITLTNVTTDQPLVTAGSLQTSSLSMGSGG